MARFGQKSTKSKVMCIVTVLLILALVGAVIGLSVSLSRSASAKVGGEVYSVGVISAETGDVDSKKDTSIYTRKDLSVDGLKCTLEKDAKITYQIFYYDKDGKFISASGMLSADFDGKGIPETAKTCKIMITPTNDEDGKVSLVEVLGYAAQLTVVVNK